MTLDVLTNLTAEVWGYTKDPFLVSICFNCGYLGFDGVTHAPIVKNVNKILLLTK